MFMPDQNEIRPGTPLQKFGEGVDTRQWELQGPIHRVQSTGTGTATGLGPGHLAALEVGGLPY